MQQIVTSSADQSELPPLSREERLKQITARYEKFEQIIKSDKDSDLAQVLSDLAREIEEFSSGTLIDNLSIQVLFGNFLPKYFKHLTTKKQF